MNKRQKPEPLIRNNTEWTLEGVGIVSLVVMIIYPIMYYSQLPDQIPIHFNIKGEADGFGPKSVIWILVVLGVGMFAMLNAILKIPHLYNYPVKVTDQNAQKLYRITQHYMIWLKVLIAFLFMSISLVIVRTALTGENQQWTVWLLGLCLVAIILVIIQLYRENKKLAVAKPNANE